MAAAGDGHLVGDRFTAADLTAAALLYPALFPEGGPERLPDTPPAVEAWLAEWAEHPGAAWVRRSTGSTAGRREPAKNAAGRGGGGRAGFSMMRPS